MLTKEQRQEKERNGYIEIIRNDKLLFLCPFCKDERWFRALAYHTRQVHGITARRLRQLFGLKANYQLITPDLKARHQDIVRDNYESNVKANLLDKGKRTRYKKGDLGHIKHLWSPQAISDMQKRGKKQFKNLWIKDRMMK